MQHDNQPNMAELIAIMQRLRDTQHGCSWDRAQTFTSLAPYLLEEVWEVLDAISSVSPKDLPDELGDLLFQILFFAQLGEEQQKFNFADICEGLASKLKRRHPLIFPANSSATLNTSNVDRSQIKMLERTEHGAKGLLTGIPKHGPALLRAQKIQERCHQVGFDWHELPPVVAKIEEELAEVLTELKKPVIDEKKLLEEVGDLLFASVNLSRHLGCQAEYALAQANDKFIRRFEKVEYQLQLAGLDLPGATLADMEQAWQRVKATEIPD